MTSPVDEINIRQANRFAKREVNEVSCGFDFCDSIGHKDFVQEIVRFHVEVLSALETEGFQKVKHSTAELIEMYLEAHRQNTRLTHETTDDNIRLIVNYRLVWQSNAVIDEPGSVNHGGTAFFALLTLDMASVFVNGPEDKNRIQTDSVIDIPLMGNMFIRVVPPIEDESND